MSVNRVKIVHFFQLKLQYLCQEFFVVEKLLVFCMDSSKGQEDERWKESQQSTVNMVNIVLFFVPHMKTFEPKKVVKK